MKKRNGSVSILVLGIIVFAFLIIVGKDPKHEAINSFSGDNISSVQVNGAKAQTMTWKNYSDMTDKEKLAYDNQHLGDQ